ncbi:hydroxysqualene dehydroxylase HpnE [Massilia sp. TS11]|uniref:hydroxysqualene dehydroxylase HpnE n=1 Tax=Massilia sp. TS11 TaxID=2908003 RepID=UPI001EDA6F3D|nr:hydroxysqualene dehydroxylase HpnE [Massilia sp. TS11]
MADKQKHIAVIGAGWAGCAAAVEVARAGHKVTLFEAARTLGGRARCVDLHGKQLDNGQHILLGAYRETLALLDEVGIARDAAFLTLPLQMRYPGKTGMDFAAPRLPAPWHVLVALWRAKGLERADKLALARFSTGARWMGWPLYEDCSVSELLERFDQTARLVQLMWRPLCLAALNTPPEQASAQVFLNVLRDSLGGRRAASDMLLPRLNLSEIFPDKAAAYLEQRGGKIRTGAKVSSLQPASGDQWHVIASGTAVGGIWNMFADGVILATPPNPAAMLLLDVEGQQLDEAITALSSFAYQPITTVYLQYRPDLRLDLPFYALADHPGLRRFGQFVFDRGQLHEKQAGLLAVVVSAASEAAALPQPALAEAVAHQLAEDLGMPALRQPEWHQVITEKRATFACTPGLVRPPNATSAPGLALAGDYTDGPYPATLEGAVRSGRAAARLVLDRFTPGKV